jgi:nucleotide-binding universal stress UspA family protein
MKVLICCDYSVAGEHVLYEAQKFLKAFPDAAIDVFSVIDMSIVSVSGMSNNGELLNSMEMDCKELQKKAEAIFAGRKISFSSEPGYLAETVLAKATNLQADLLILGTHGRTGLERIMLGSVAENVLRHVKCNTLIVPVKHKSHEQNTSK